ncbi:MAG: MarR family transcriptional regulator [Novosphingobium lindaniclasticum]|jgi:hypothetical protein|uniref:hypothetical protein n=1 Tax=Novosphingobium lindaniclasticum TaxID=1329895 RepID=UPI00240981A2|nr:hypothetical protein [Novosphingobium lindaniclasticum]MDF2639485.1 MarR family transcriptional regulator [Novosphingobium lindaniclasticum]
MARKLGDDKTDEGQREPISQHHLTQLAEHICECRNLRNELFGVDFFGDPAWDILMDLYAAQGGGRPLRLPGPGPKITQRWQQILELEGLVWLRRGGAGAKDELGLTEKGAALMQDYLQRAACIA